MSSTIFPRFSPLRCIGVGTFDGAPHPPEVAEPLPGDASLPRAQFRATRAISIDAPPDAVWPWLVQVGALRAGWYSNDLLDNLGRPSADHRRARAPAPRDRPMGADGPIGNAVRSQHVSGPFVPGERVDAVDQARQHLGVAAVADRRSRHAPGYACPRRLRLAAPTHRSSWRRAHGVRRLRHATQDAARDHVSSRDTGFGGAPVSLAIDTHVQRSTHQPPVPRCDRRPEGNPRTR